MGSLKNFLWGFGHIVFCFAGLVLIALCVSFFQSIGGQAPPAYVQAPLPFYLQALLYLVYAYLEEAVFRVYLINKIAASFNLTAAVAASVLLFAFFHRWEGHWGVINSIFAAVLLSFVYLRTKNIHIIALSHGIYNIFAASVPVV